MRFSVDAHTIGCHLTGNEVYIRNLLNECSKLAPVAVFMACVPKDVARLAVPSRILTRKVSENPYKRRGWDLPIRLRQVRPDLLHVQYTAPSGCSAPVVVSVHDVIFLEFPEYFTRY